jgi:membrane protease YdiL (CAAX protease family)
MMHNAIRAAEQAAAMKQERKDIWIFALAVLATTTLIAASFPLFHITNNWAGNALMFIPGLAAAVLLLKRRQGFKSVGWGLGGSGGAIYWLLAILLPMAMIAISLPISIRLGWAAIAPASTAAGRVAGDPLKILKNVLLYTAISLPLAFGEEFGWRGYAQGKMVRQFGLVKGLLLLGLLWGFWHTPIYYFMGTSPEHPLLGPFVMTPIDNLLAAVPMAWFYIRSRNIWVPTFLHAFADVVWGFSDLLYPKSHELQSWALLQALQLILTIFFLWNLRSRPEGVERSGQPAFAS